MKDKIEVGEYIRTNQGIIGKIKRIELDKIDKSLKWYVFDKKRPDMNIIDEIYINKPYIVNHNKIKSEIVEVGDYVNGYKIFRIDKLDDRKVFKIYEQGQTDYLRVWRDEDIETILTKEQFEANCYKVGGEKCM